MICEYADRSHDGPHLFPKGNAVHWQALAGFEARVNGLRDSITIGQINISAALSYMGFPFSAKDWRHLTPVLPT